MQSRIAGRPGFGLTVVRGRAAAQFLETFLVCGAFTGQEFEQCIVRKMPGELKPDEERVAMWGEGTVSGEPVDERVTTRRGDVVDLAIRSAASPKRANRDQISGPKPLEGTVYLRLIGRPEVARPPVEASGLQVIAREVLLVQKTEYRMVE